MFTYKRLRDKEVASVLRAALGMVEKIEAVDPLTVKFTLSIPYVRSAAVAAGYQAMIVCASRLMDTITTKPIGTGPFRFVEYQPGDQLVLEKNPDYFLPGCRSVDRAVMRIIPEYTTAVAGLESGALDMVYDLPPEQVDQLKDSTVARVEEVAVRELGRHHPQQRVQAVRRPARARGLHQDRRPAGIHRHRHVRPRHAHGHADSADASVISARTC